MKYKDFEVDIALTNYVEGVVTIPLPDGSLVCIPEEGATQEELDIIQQIKDDVANRPVPDVVPIVPMPSTEERLSAMESAIAAMMGV